MTKIEGFFLIPFFQTTNFFLVFYRILERLYELKVEKEDAIRIAEPPTYPLFFTEAGFLQLAFSTRAPRLKLATPLLSLLLADYVTFGHLVQRSEGVARQLTLAGISSV